MPGSTRVRKTSAAPCRSIHCELQETASGVMNHRTGARESTARPKVRPAWKTSRSPRKMPVKQARVPTPKPMVPRAIISPAVMQVRSSLIRVENARIRNRITSAIPSTLGMDRGSKGAAAAATRPGAAVARVVASPRSTRATNSPIGVATASGRTKAVKWSPSSIRSSACGTTRACSRATAGDTSTSRSPWRMSIGPAYRSRMPRYGRWSVS